MLWDVDKEGSSRGSDDTHLFHKMQKIFVDNLITFYEKHKKSQKSAIKMN